MKRVESRSALLWGIWLAIFLLGCKISGEANNDPDTIVYGSPLIDREGNPYRTVIIDGKTWMADNFKGIRGADGVYYTLGEHGSYWGIENQASTPSGTYFYNTTTKVSGGSNPEDQDSGIAFAVRYVKE